MTKITYIGHATTLIESNGLAVLTDPNFSRWVLCFPRRAELNYDPGKLPDLSAVVISHAHYDHLDFFSFKYIKSSVPVFVPEGLGEFVSKFIRNPVIELQTWAPHKLPSDIEIIPTYAQHRGSRWTGLRYRKNNGYIITLENTRIFFQGDSGYGPHFKEIGKTYSIDVALLPIGGYAPRWLKRQHLNPTEALEVFLDLGAKEMIPIHHGTFRMSTEPPNQPAEWLSRVAAERNLSERVHVLKSGERYEF